MTMNKMVIAGAWDWPAVSSPLLFKAFLVKK